MLFFFIGKSETEAVRNAIISNWNRGIQREVYKCEEDEDNPKKFNCVKFKLNGYPFGLGATSKDQSIQCRLMAAAMLKSLYNLGWKVITFTFFHILSLFCFTSQKSMNRELIHQQVSIYHSFTLRIHLF